MGSQIEYYQDTAHDTWLRVSKMPKKARTEACPPVYQAQELQYNKETRKVRNDYFLVDESYLNHHCVRVKSEHLPYTIKTLFTMG